MLTDSSYSGLAARIAHQVHGLHGSSYMEGNLQTIGMGDGDMNAGGNKHLLTVHPFGHSTPIHAHLPQKLSQMHSHVNMYAVQMERTHRFI